jgi:hypothetical protein
MKLIKLFLLKSGMILISQVEEVSTYNPLESSYDAPQDFSGGLGGPDCKLTKPFVVNKDKTLEPFLSGYTKKEVFELSSDNIITLTEPTPTLLEKYQDLIKE